MYLLGRTAIVFLNMPLVVVKMETKFSMRVELNISQMSFVL